MSKFSTLTAILLGGAITVGGLRFYHDYVVVQPLPPTPSRIHLSSRAVHHKTTNKDALTWFVTNDSNDRVVARYLDKKLDYLEKMATDHPELIKGYLAPVLDDIVKLQKMKCADPGFRDAFDQLGADLDAIDTVLGEDWT